MTKMGQINSKDEAILSFIEARGEVFFKELDEAKLMAKSTLSKHLKELQEDKYIIKKISKNHSVGSYCVVYDITSKGKKLLVSNIKQGTLEDW